MIDERPTHPFTWMENLVAGITIWHYGKNVRESRATPTVHRDRDRAGGLTRLAHRGRRADRKHGGVGAVGTHCGLMT